MLHRACVHLKADAVLWLQPFVYHWEYAQLPPHLRPKTNAVGKLRSRFIELLSEKASEKSTVPHSRHHSSALLHSIGSNHRSMSVLYTQCMFTLDSSASKCSALMLTYMPCLLYDTNWSLILHKGIVMVYTCCMNV